MLRDTVAGFYVVYSANNVPSDFILLGKSPLNWLVERRKDRYAMLSQIDSGVLLYWTPIMITNAELEDWTKNAITVIDER